MSVCTGQEKGRQCTTYWEREFGMGKLITDTILSWIVIAIECVGPYQMISFFPNGNKTFYIHTFVNEGNYLLIKDVHLAHIR